MDCRVGLPLMENLSQSVSQSFSQGGGSASASCVHQQIRRCGRSPSDMDSSSVPVPSGPPQNSFRVSENSCMHSHCESQARLEHDEFCMVAPSAPCAHVCEPQGSALAAR